jgi:hypothetical protein
MSKHDGIYAKGGGGTPAKSSGIIERTGAYRPVESVGGPYVIDQPGSTETPRMTKPEPYMRPGREAGGEYLAPKRSKRS